jgi:hypothetical protein
LFLPSAPRAPQPQFILAATRAMRLSTALAIRYPRMAVGTFIPFSDGPKGHCVWGLCAMRNALCGCVATGVLLLSGTLTFANDINGTVGRIPDWGSCSRRLCLRLGKSWRLLRQSNQRSVVCLLRASCPPSAHQSRAWNANDPACGCVPCKAPPGIRKRMRRPSRHCNRCCHCLRKRRARKQSTPWPTRAGEIQKMFSGGRPSRICPTVS